MHSGYYLEGSCTRAIDMETENMRIHTGWQSAHSTSMAKNICSGMRAHLKLSSSVHIAQSWTFRTCMKHQGMKHLNSAKCLADRVTTIAAEHSFNAHRHHLQESTQVSAASYDELFSEPSLIHGLHSSVRRLGCTSSDQVHAEHIT